MNKFCHTQMFTQMLDSYMSEQQNIDFIE